MRLLIKPLFILALLFAPLPAWSYYFTVTIDTSALAGTEANLAFDYIDGDGIGNYSVGISHFSTDGVFDPDAATSVGGVGGTLAKEVFFDVSEFFNEFLQPLTLGNRVQFRLNPAGQAIPDFSAAPTIPDAFSLFILDEAGLLPLFATTDPTGSDALFTLDFTGKPHSLTVYAPLQAAVTWTVQPVPLPGAFSLMLIAGLWTYGFNGLRRSVNRS